MEAMNSPLLPTVAIVVLSSLIIAAIKLYDSRKLDPREPPVVPSKIPYVGHLLGMVTYGSKYFKRLGSRHRYPIFTLPTLSSRTYIVTDPNLAASVQRASKALSFNPVIPRVTQRVLGFDAATIQLMKSDMEHGFVQEIQELVHARLSPGDSLDSLTLAAGNEFLECINAYRAKASAGSNGEHEDFLRWVKKIVTHATANFLYGPENPLKDSPELADRFWDFDSGIPKLLVGIVPSYTAKKAYDGRETLVTAFHQFEDSEGYKRAAKLTQDRAVIATRHGVSKANIARSDLSFFFAGIVNTSLTSFWLALNIFVRPALLASIRDEIESTLQTSTEGNGAAVFSMKRIVKDCPLLVSCFRETLRLYSDNFATRVVTEDTVLADTYFLQKGSILQISGGIMHAKNSIWGDSVDEFDPQRFLPREKGTKQQHHPAAFRAFGGGSTLCPGRHFALNEIVGFVAMVVLMFDVTGPNNTTLKLPTKKEDVVPIHVLEPITKSEVCMRVREAWKNAALKIEV